MHEDGRRAGLLAARAATRRWRSCATTSLRGGIRDGVPGFIISAMNAYYVFLKFAKLWELAQTASKPKPNARDPYANLA